MVKLSDQADDFFNCKSVSFPPFSRFNTANWLQYTVISTENHHKKCALWLAALTWIIQWDNLLFTLLRSRKVVLGCRVGWLWPVLFVHWGVGGSKHCCGWLADLSVQLHSHSESSCWLYNFTTFTCARPTRDLHRFTPFSVVETLVATSALLLPDIYALHFQALWSDDSENYINSSS